MYCFSLFCRLCFRRDCKLLNLFTKDDDMVTFNEKLKSCIPEIISDDDRVPNFICDNCCVKLRKGYEFKTMCIKNHIALRDYARHLLKYMENPVNNQTILNMKLNRTDTESIASDSHERDRIESENDSEYSEDNQRKVKQEYPSEHLNNSHDEPLALVKSDRRNQIEISENSEQYSTHITDVPMTNIKSENYSDDDSDDYQCEDLSQKSRLVIDEDRDSDDIPQQNLPPSVLPNFNLQNNTVMSYLKLEFSDKDDSSRTNDMKSVDQPKDLSMADSETEQEDQCTWNMGVQGESHKKMKTRTKDKYRIVYTENQRLELEKEFIISRYITSSRKMQLSTTLNLSQRQIKIWFQNRRAKERKQVKRSVEQLGSDNTEIVNFEANRNIERCSPSLASKDIATQILDIQKERFILQTQKEAYYKQNNKEGYDDLYKLKEELLNKRLQVLLQRQKDVNNEDNDNSSN